MCQVVKIILRSLFLLLLLLFIFQLQLFYLHQYDEEKFISYILRLFPFYNYSKGTLDMVLSERPVYGAKVVPTSDGYEAKFGVYVRPQTSVLSIKVHHCMPFAMQAKRLELQQNELELTGDLEWINIPNIDQKCFIGKQDVAERHIELKALVKFRHESEFIFFDHLFTRVNEWEELLVIPIFFKDKVEKLEFLFGYNSKKYTNLFMWWTKLPVIPIFSNDKLEQLEFLSSFNDNKSQNVQETTIHPTGLDVEQQKNFNASLIAVKITHPDDQDNSILHLEIHSSFPDIPTFNFYKHCPELPNILTQVDPCFQKGNDCGCVKNISIAIPNWQHFCNFVISKTETELILQGSFGASRVITARAGGFFDPQDVSVHLATLEFNIMFRKSFNLVASAHKIPQNYVSN